MPIVLNALHEATPEVVAKLKAAGIKNCRHLLEACRAPADRVALAERLGIEPELVHRLANRADLSRIRNIGSTFSRLLEEAGVETAADLARCSPDELRARLIAINKEKRLSGRVPAQAMVRGWVSKAQKLPQVLEYE